MVLNFEEKFIFIEHNTLKVKYIDVEFFVSEISFFSFCIIDSIKVKFRMISGDKMNLKNSPLCVIIMYNLVQKCGCNKNCVNDFLVACSYITAGFCCSLFNPPPRSKRGL